MDGSSQLMFALQSPLGLRFGATHKVEKDRIIFEIDVPLKKGSHCSFRMELSGEEETIMGEVRIDRVLPKREGSLPRYIAKIVKMPEADRRSFEGWRRDLSTGGISRRMERDTAAVRLRLTEQMQGSTEAEARVVLDRMNAKSIYKRKEADRVEGDPFGLSHESGTAERADGDDIRSQLRESVQQLPDRLPTTPRLDEEADTHIGEAEQPKPSRTDPNWLRPPSETQRSSSSQDIEWLDKQVPLPLVVVDGGGQLVRISVTYLSAESYYADYLSGLRSSMFTVADVALETLYLPVELQFRLPDGSSITCQGQTVANTPQGTTMALEFDRKQRQHLTEVAGV
jgi:hypothetical protein